MCSFITKIGIYDSRLLVITARGKEIYNFFLNRKFGTTVAPFLIKVGTQYADKILQNNYNDKQIFFTYFLISFL